MLNHKSAKFNGSSKGKRNFGLQGNLEVFVEGHLSFLKFLKY